MDRRDFLKQTSLGGVGLALSKSSASANSLKDAPPNILYVVLDELRFPKVFPAGVKDVGQFLHRFMPNTYRLWKNGVKFARHFTAGNACTPSRSVLMTGLYTQQTWMLQTLKGTPDTKISIPPVLDPAFPTYGKLLRKAGYQTPYIGKWHLSLTKKVGDLNHYGFDSMTHPDPTGANLQGSVGDHTNGYLNDRDIAAQAASWLSQRTTSEQPWCLTVCFANPHDHMFFWAGTEFQTYNNLFDAQSTYLPSTFYSTNNGTNYPPVVSWDDDILKNPPAYGYPAVPPNWESAAQIAANKPSTQTFARAITQYVWGGISDDPGQSEFSLQPYPGIPGAGMALAPYSYWQRNLDSYTQIMGLADQQVGAVLDALPPDVAENTVIVFTADHGDYAGAHGIVANKWGSGYDEVFHVPLIVFDPTGRFAGDVDTVRDELTSSVDMFSLLVSLGHNGSQHWLAGKYGPVYGRRHDMIPMLQSAAAPGRDFVLLVTDEISLPVYNFNDAPLHIVGVRTKDEKLVTYSKWHKFSTRVAGHSVELEFYDYATPGGRAEIDNTPDDPRARQWAKRLHKDIVPNELRAPLPPPLIYSQLKAELQWVEFADLVAHAKGNLLKQWLGLGGDA